MLEINVRNVEEFLGTLSTAYPDEITGEAIAKKGSQNRNN